MPKLLNNSTTATIADGKTETSEIDMGRSVDTLLVLLPALASCSVSLKVAPNTGGTFTQLGPDTYNSNVGTGGFWIELRAHKFRYFKIVSSVAQAGGDDFTVIGGTDGN